MHWLWPLQVMPGLHKLPGQQIWPLPPHGVQVPMPPD
jgi:hypothetical protein